MVKLDGVCQRARRETESEPETFRDPDTSIEVGSPEIRVVIDRTKAADLGVERATSPRR